MSASPPSKNRQRATDPGRRGLWHSVKNAMLALMLAQILSGCASLPKPLLENELSIRLSNACWRGAQKAMAGDPAGFHECFYAAYSRVRDPMRGGEDLESIRETLNGLLAAVGDQTFSSRLAAESEPVRSGVAWFLTSADLSHAPETRRVLAKTRDFDFELERAYRRN
jgi:hypothetical protein